MFIFFLPVWICVLFLVAKLAAYQEYFAKPKLNSYLTFLQNYTSTLELEAIITSSLHATAAQNLVWSCLTHKLDCICRFLCSLTLPSVITVFFLRFLPSWSAFFFFFFWLPSILVVMVELEVWLCLLYATQQEKYILLTFSEDILGDFQNL